MKSYAFATAIRVLSGASVRWTGAKPDVRQRIYFANHTSHLDAPLVWAALPAEVREFTLLTAANDYWSAGKLRYLLASRVFNAILIERGRFSYRNNPLTILLGAMGDRYSLILFPEGTRSGGSEIGEFRCGLYHLAKHRPELELVPVYIANLWRILPRGALLPVPLLSSVSFGSPIRLQVDEPKTAFLERARNAVRALKLE